MLMLNDVDKIRQLEQRIAALEERLAKLSEKHQRDVKALMGCDDVLDKHRKAMLAELNDAFERIAHIELTLFPHLPKDIDHLNKVIGDQDTKAYNPLDFRDPSKKSR
jgi:predicted  nucleic acid-binding Zn-ribbon protein